MRQRFNVNILITLFSLIAIQSGGQEKLLDILHSGNIRKLKNFYIPTSLDSGIHKQVSLHWSIQRPIIPHTSYVRFFGTHWENRKRYHLDAILYEKHAVIWRLTLLDQADKYLLVDTINNIALDADERYERYPTYNNVEELVRKEHGTLIDTGSGTTFADFARSFKSFYGADFNPVLSLARFDFGSCGLGGDISSKTIFSIIANADTSTFSKWLRSGSFELQLYALSGYMQSGKMPIAEVNYIIEYLSTSTVVVDECLGCTSQLTTVRDIMHKQGFLKLMKK